MRDEYKHGTTNNALQAKTLYGVKTTAIKNLEPGAGFSFTDRLYIYGGTLHGIHTALAQCGNTVSFTADAQVIPAKVQFTSL